MHKALVKCIVLIVAFIILDSSMVEHSAVNRVVVGSSPTRGVKLCEEGESRRHGEEKETAPWSSG